MSSKQLSDEQFDAVAALFLTLSDPLRLRILHQILHTARYVGELQRLVRTSQSNVSKHLAILLRAGLVRRQKVGVRVLYEAQHQALQQLCSVACGIEATNAERRYREVGRGLAR